MENNINTAKTRAAKAFMLNQYTILDKLLKKREQEKVKFNKGNKFFQADAQASEDTQS